MKDELKGIGDELGRLGGGFEGIGGLISLLAKGFGMLLADALLELLDLIESTLMGLNIILAVFQDLRTIAYGIGTRVGAPGLFEDPAERKAFMKVGNRPFQTLDAIGRFNTEVLGGRDIRVENNIYTNDVEGAVAATGMANERLARAEAGPR